ECGAAFFHGSFLDSNPSTAAALISWKQSASNSDFSSRAHDLTRINGERYEAAYRESSSATSGTGAYPVPERAGVLRFLRQRPRNDQTAVEDGDPSGARRCCADRRARRRGRILVRPVHRRIGPGVAEYSRPTRRPDDLPL